MKDEQTVHDLVMLILKNMDLSGKSSGEVVALYLQKTAEVKAEFSKHNAEKLKDRELL